MSKLRPSCQSAMPQSMRSLSKRQTRFDRLVEDGAQGALRPSCPTDEAINPNRQTGVQRKKRSTPIAERVSSGRRTNVKLQPPDWTEDEGLSQLRRFDPCCLRRTNVKLRFSSNSLVGDRGRANHPPDRPVQQGSRTQVSMVGNLGKSQTVRLVSPLRDPQKEGLQHPFRRLPPNRSQNLTANPSHSRPGYRHNSPKLSLFRSSRFLIALRVSKSAV